MAQILRKTAEGCREDTILSMSHISATEKQVTVDFAYFTGSLSEIVTICMTPAEALMFAGQLVSKTAMRLDG